MTRAAIRFVFCGVWACVTAAVPFAQTSTRLEEKTFQVIAVDGNQLVVALPEGTRELTVPADFKFTVDGKTMSIQELKPGMSGTATITTTTTVTPVSVTEVKNGTVAKAMGTSILVLTDGKYQMFTQGDVDKRGVKIMRDGQPAQVSDFRENDRLTATIITSKPPRVLTEQEVKATLAKSSPPSGVSVAASSPVTSQPGAAPAPQTAAATMGTAPRKLPKTAGPLPSLGLVGLASLLSGVGLTIARRRRTQ